MKEKKELSKRQIILETDWDSVSIIKAEVAWAIELKAILTLLLEWIKNK